jgi:hypothetical protein
VLLQAELRRIGRDDVEVVSRGATKAATERRDRINDFAMKALLEALGPRIDDDIMNRARNHWSKGVSELSRKHFDLIVFVDRHRHSPAVSDCGIFAGNTSARRIPDRAFRVLKEAEEAAGKTFGLADDHDGKVLSAYRKQTELLLKYARDLRSVVTSP